MYTELSVAGFRCFESLRVDGLGQVNLLVGTNNSGKTSILEAVGLLASGGDWRHLINPLLRRGEVSWQEVPRNRSLLRTQQIRHLFRGHQVQPGVSAEIVGNQHLKERDEVKLAIDSVDDVQAQLQLEQLPDARLALHVRATTRAGTNEYRVPLTDTGDTDPEWGRRKGVAYAEGPALASFVSTAALDASDMVQLASSVQLTDEEDRVLEALRVIEPEVEAFRPLVPRRPFFPDESTRGGIIVRLRGVKEPVPIGSLGDGAWRILGLAVALASSAGRVLLVDEIDTGLHYSVMVDMWRMVQAAAERLNVQIFATTHSRDCVEALAALARELPSSSDRLTIHRVERSGATTIAYSADEIVAAATRGIEIR
jgi:predicted ATPase